MIWLQASILWFDYETDICGVAKLVENIGLYE